MGNDGNISTGHVIAESIPEAFYGAMKVVFEHGYELRTQYDRKDPKGNFIDPPGRDAKVLIEIKNPFAEPRFPPISYCEIGKYIAEFLGAKDHLVVPYEELKKLVKSKEKFAPKEWPYCYHERLYAYPLSDGTTLNQIDLILDRLAEDPITRRAIAQTGIPEIDQFIKEDQPCLREIQIRAIEDGQGNLDLNLHAHWRSRDLYKAWCDNVIGISNLHRQMAQDLAAKTKRTVKVGAYTESNGSLHLYGQDYSEKGLDKFFKNFPDLETFIQRSMTSETARDLLVIPQLEDLLKEDYWNFPPESIALIQKLIHDFRKGIYLP